MSSPGSIDPYATVKAAGVQVEVIPEETYQPPPTPETPNPDPVVIPGTTRLVPDLAALPALLKSPDGPWLDLPAAVALLWQIFQSLEIRTVGARVTLTSSPVTVWLPSTTVELPVTWEQTPPAVPTGAIISVEAGTAWVGYTSARIKPGSITAAGCVILATSGPFSTVVPSVAQPISYTAQGLYLHTPTLDLGAP